MKKMFFALLSLTFSVLSGAQTISPVMPVPSAYQLRWQDMEMFAVYLSPWDRNHPEYARPAYVEYFRNQLRELLTNYGEIFEVWFDGANGGDGWYGGANETRKIDVKKYYNWPETYKMIRQLQPHCLVTHYTLWGSTDWNKWEKLATGEFSNIVNNPIWQTIKFPTAKVRVLRFEADRLAEGKRLGYSDLDIY